MTKQQLNDIRSAIATVNQKAMKLSDRDKLNISIMLSNLSGKLSGASIQSTLKKAKLP